MNRVYLDWNASAPLRPEARAAWLEAVELLPGNPSSVHAFGREACGAWESARARCAALLGCRPHELIVTSGGSEANALAIRGAGAEPIAVAASAVEHSSVLRNAERRGPLRLLGVDSCGRIDLAALGAQLDDSVGLCCIQFANNELGTLQDVPALVAALRERSPRCLVLLDCCQGAGKRRLDLHALGIDYASIAGHKLGALRGTGLLYVRSGVALRSQIMGGRQQDDRRSGTEDVAGLAALTAALAAGLSRSEAEERRQERLLESCFAQITAALPDARWLAHDADRLACTMSLAHPGVDGEALVTRLDLAGFALSRGAACMARSGRPSHVIAALGLPAELALGAIRVSIGWTTTAAELDAFAQAYVHEVRQMM